MFCNILSMFLTITTPQGVAGCPLLGRVRQPTCAVTPWRKIGIQGQPKIPAKGSFGNKFTWQIWSRNLKQPFWFSCFNLVGGGGNMQGQNWGPWPPKPDTWDRYKVFCLKDHILSAKKKRGPSHITFWIFWHLWPIGSHWEKRNQPIKMMPNELLSIDLAS